MKRLLLLLFAAFAFLVALFSALLEVLTKAFPSKEQNDANGKDRKPVGNNVGKE